ncbi:uncharacterized protein Dana_GF13325 [Drosophila ananassae]|uniref:Uncharacterized protein n=1 Tax=Drosophila ananassae TaxID=7217 RepID=B3MBZ8_DROAN|nr:uncharacterized protein Dana_GF13325 [Drosophila ananassae]
MEAQLFFQFNPASLILCFLCISLLDYFFNNWTQPVEHQGFTIAPLNSSPIKMHRVEGETPLARDTYGLRYLQLRHRERLLSGVKRKLDEQF